MPKPPVLESSSEKQHVDVDLFLKGMLMVVVLSKGMEGKWQVLPENVSSVPGEPLGNTDNDISDDYDITEDSQHFWICQCETQTLTKVRILLKEIWPQLRYFSLAIKGKA